MELVAEKIKTRVCELIRENFNGYFKYWIGDAWHAGFPTLYVDVVFGTLDKKRTLRGRLGDRLYDDLQKKIETMGEHVSHASEAFFHTMPDCEEDDICRFVSHLIDAQVADDDFSMFFEEDTDDENPITTSPPAPV
jgi:hypothetical protein